MWRFSPHDHNTSSRHQSIVYPPPLHSDYYFVFRVIMVWVFLFALGVVVDMCCRLFFIWGCCWLLFLHILVVIYFGVLFFCIWWLTSTDLYPPTRLARVLRWRVSLHTEMLAGGWCVGVGENNQSTYHRTHPVNHLPTNSHPSSHTHPTTMQGFCADVHRWTMEAIPKLLLENNTNRRTADAVA